jgi:ribosomal protein L37AE/L43A
MTKLQAKRILHPTLVLHHVCPHCAIPYLPKRSDQVWCSPNCRKSYWRRLRAREMPKTLER